MTSERQDLADAALPPAFRRLLVAWAGSLTGDGLRVVALPLLAVLINPSPVAVATVAGATTLPWLLVAIPAGALVDRWNPARVMSTAHVVRAVLTVLLAVVVVAGAATIPLLCALGFAITSAETFADGAAQSLLVRVVPGRNLERANARFVTIETLALDIAGPVAAGVSFLVAPWLPFLISAACFLGAAAAAASIGAASSGAATSGAASSGSASSGSARTDAGGIGAARGSTGRQDTYRAEGAAPDEPFIEPHLGVAPDQRTGPVQQIKTGLGRLIADPVLRILAITVAIMAVGNAAADAVMVLYGTRNLGMSEAVYPTLLVSYSLGTLLAAGLVGRAGSRLRGGQIMVLAIFGIAGTMLLLGFFPNIVVALLAYAVMGLAGGTWNVLSATRRQRRTPESMIARVSSAFRVIAWGLMPVGAAVGGLIAESWGVPAVFVVSGAVIALLGLVVARSFAADEPLPAQPAID